jgi:hypothetical protein
MLGLVFIKYGSDAFDIRREELKAQLNDPTTNWDRFIKFLIYDLPAL